MSAAVEAIRRVVIRRKSQVPEEAFSPHPIEPASNEERQILERECEKILAKRYFEGQDFNQFISNVIKLLGGRQYSPEIEQSYDFAVEEQGRSSVLYRVRTKQQNYGVISMAPLWTYYTEDEAARSAPIARHQTPYAIENLVYGEKTGQVIMPLSPTPQGFVKFQLVGTKGDRKPIFKSFVFDGNVDVFRNFEALSYPIEPEVAQIACTGVYQAYQLVKGTPLSQLVRSLKIS